MEVKQEVVKVFSPVTITLNTIKEVNLVAALLGGITDRVTQEFGIPAVSINNAYKLLDDIAEDSRPCFKVLQLQG